MDAQSFADATVGWINANFSDEVIVDYSDAFNRLTFALGKWCGIREGVRLWGDNHREVDVEIVDGDGDGGSEGA